MCFVLVPLFLRELAGTNVWSVVQLPFTKFSEYIVIAVPFFTFFLAKSCKASVGVFLFIFTHKVPFLLTNPASDLVNPCRLLMVAKVDRSD